MFDSHDVWWWATANNREKKKENLQKNSGKAHIFILELKLETKKKKKKKKTLIEQPTQEMPNHSSLLNQQQIYINIKNQNNNNNNKNGCLSSENLFHFIYIINKLTESWRMYKNRIIFIIWKWNLKNLLLLVSSTTTWIE